MALEAVNSNSIGFKPSVRTNLKTSQNFTSKPEEIDEEKSNATKYMIGATALAAVVGLGIAGYKGKLGKGIQKFLGGAAKSAEKDVSKAGNDAPKIDPEKYNEEGRKAYLDIKQKLDGNITCNVKDRKSNELNELGQYYHAQEMKMNNIMNNIKEQLIKENKLNYQIEFKNNKISVEKGEIANLTNEKGDPWQITEATDKEFVKGLKYAINKENEKRVVNEFSTKEGLNYLETQEKLVQQKKLQSDKNNEEWIKRQRQIKEKEYSNFWNNALEQQAKETFFEKSLETINLRANGLKLNGEIVANGQKFVFKRGKLEKVLDANNKEIKMDENVNFEDLESVLRKKYEQKVVVPRLKKKIKNATSMYTENMKNIDSILKGLSYTPVPKNGEVTKKLADKEYTFCFHKNEGKPYLKLVKVVEENGKKQLYSYGGGILDIQDGKDSYRFLNKKGKYKLITMNRDINNCNIGDVSYYGIPYYKSDNQAEVRYKMPNCAYYKENAKAIKFDFCHFYTDLKTYYNQHYLGS